MNGGGFVAGEGGAPALQQRDEPGNDQRVPHGIGAAQLQQRWRDRRGAATRRQGRQPTAHPTAASTYASALLTGPMRFLTGSRMEIVPFASTLPAGDYWLAHMFTSSTSVTGTNYTAGTVITTQSRLGLLENAMGAFKRIGNSTTNSTTCPVLFHGYLATTTAAASSAIATADVRSTTGRMYWNYAETTV